jgi:hypothetical protein
MASKPIGVDFSLAIPGDGGLAERNYTFQRTRAADSGRSAVMQENSVKGLARRKRLS